MFFSWPFFLWARDIWFFGIFVSCDSEGLKAAERMPSEVVDLKLPLPWVEALGAFWFSYLCIVSALVYSIESPSLTLLKRVFTLHRSGLVTSSLMLLMFTRLVDFRLIGLYRLCDSGESPSTSVCTCSVSMTSVTWVVYLFTKKSLKTLSGEKLL